MNHLGKDNHQKMRHLDGWKSSETVCMNKPQIFKEKKHDIIYPAIYLIFIYVNYMPQAFQPYWISPCLKMSHLGTKDEAS